MPFSVLIPQLSNPIFSMLVEIPTADKTISQSRISIPFADLIVTLHPEPVVSTFSTDAPVKILIPFFL